MDEQIEHSRGRRFRRGALVLVALAAVAMGLPTVRGGFVGGDDHRLALDHVLVNRPSLEHAVQLFAIAHRDLYQPLPLLSFSAEFLICDWLGLTRGGPERFAWFFHLNNVWLHAINSVLVWFVVAMLHRRMRSAATVQGARSGDSSSLRGRAPSFEPSVVATIAALVFAVHPLNTEVVAWVNGRMMLLSTLFGLLSLLALDAWLTVGRDGAGRPGATCGRRRLWLATAVVMLTLLCAISKIRIGLPVLMVVVAWAGRDRILTRRFLPVWLVCAVVTAVFVVINVQATAAAELFMGGSEHLKGPRSIRVFSALAFYFTHYVYPIGLASYYPTPPTVSWSDAQSWQAVLVATPVLAVLGWAAWRSHVWRLGVIWFFATMAATLPFMPARNVLAADRYMYLPMIGLLWPTCVSLLQVWTLVIVRTRSWVRRGLVPAAVVVVVLAMIGQCWNVAWYYETPLKKTLRVALLFPDVPRVWERLGWSYHEIGDYERASELAQRELVHDTPDVRSGAYQLMGMSAFKSGRTEEALEWLHKALEVDPDNALGKYRLATVYDDIGQYDKALPYFEDAVAAAPKNNPTIQRLASVYRKLGRRADARRLLEQAIENNAFEVRAYVGLAEMAIEQGDRALVERARDQLTDLLAHIPDTTQVWVTLGLVEVKLGRFERAIQAYRRALSLDPQNVAALLNLAKLYENNGEVGEAGALYERAAQLALTIAQAEVISDFYMSQGAWGRAVALWDAVVGAHPRRVDARVQRAWVYALAGDLEAARVDLDFYEDAEGPSGLSTALRSFIALAEGDGARANALVDPLVGGEAGAGGGRRRLLVALERFDQVSPGNEWTYYLAARLLAADENAPAARASLDIAARVCAGDACRARVSALIERLGTNQSD